MVIQNIFNCILVVVSFEYKTYKDRSEVGPVLCLSVSSYVGGENGINSAMSERLSFTADPVIKIWLKPLVYGDVV